MTLEKEVNSFYWKLKNILGPLISITNRAEISGIENIPEGSAILAANHSGSYFLDGFLLSAVILDRQVHTVAHYTDFKLPGAELFLKKVGAYVLDRRIEDIEEDNTIVQALNGGELLGIFPEESYHTFWQKYTLFKFHEQVSKYAEISESPVVPTAVVGAEEASGCIIGWKDQGESFHKGVSLVLPWKVRIILGSPMYYSGQGYEKFAGEIKDNIAEILSNYRDVKISNVDYLQKKGFL